MKKLFALMLAVAMLASMATVVSAAETTLTVNVLPAEYTLSIPESQTIQYGEDCRIGIVTVTESSSFAAGKNLEVTVEYDGHFICDSVSTTIPYEIIITANPEGETETYKDQDFPSGSVLTFEGTSNGTLAEKASKTFEVRGSSEGRKPTRDIEDLVVCVNAQDWGKALAGTYTTTITFTAEVVAEVAGG